MSDDIQDNATVNLVFIPGATGPLPSHRRYTKARGEPPRVVTEDIPVIKFKVNGVDKTWTRMQIARETGLSLTTISKLFTGSRKPSLRTAKTLATYFGITIERLLMEVLPRWEIKLVSKPRPVPQPK